MVRHLDFFALHTNSKCTLLCSQIWLHFLAEMAASSFIQYLRILNFVFDKKVVLYIIPRGFGRHLDYFA
jgi:hypothetical protein